MAIPFRRYVKSTDDGCGVDQCLSCYRQWEGRGSEGWKFCPFCGVEWVGKLNCREYHEKKWLYLLKQQDEEKWRNWEYSRIDLPLKRGWVIEVRTCKKSQGETTRSEWTVEHWQSDYGITTLRMVISHLKYLRDQARLDSSDLPWQHWFEYRARIADFNKPAYGYSSTIWRNSLNLEEKSLIEIWN